MKPTPDRLLTKRCNTCIFTQNGKLMHLHEGRLDEMIADCEANDTNVICHKSKSLTGEFPWDVWCYGSFEVIGPGQLMRIQERLGLLERVDPPT